MIWIMAIAPISNRQSFDFEMSPVSMEVILGGIFRLGLLLVGGLCVYLGYRLFLNYPVKEGGDLSAKWGEKQFLLKRGAPGTLFALFGAAIIVVGIVHGGSATQAITGIPELSPPPLPDYEPIGPTIYEHASTSPVRTFDDASVPPVTSQTQPTRAPSAQ